MLRFLLLFEFVAWREMLLLFDLDFLSSPPASLQDIWI